MREDRNSLNSTCLCVMFLLSTSGRKLDMASLIEELFVGTKWEVARSIYSHFGIVTRRKHHGRMVGAIEGNIVCGVLGIRYTNTLDQAHSTWENGIMTFHMHDHRDHRNIPKDSHKISMQHKECILLDIKCRNASKEFE